MPGHLLFTRNRRKDLLWGFLVSAYHDSEGKHDVVLRDRWDNVQSMAQRLALVWTTQL